MTLVGGSHVDHGATFGERGGREVVAHYGRPDRAVRAVRNGVGVIEMAYGVVVVTGAERRAFVDAAVTNRVPETDGEGCYAVILDDAGAVATELFVYAAGERLLVFTPPGYADGLAADWEERLAAAGHDAAVRAASGEFGVFGVHGPMATEKVASVLHGAGAPAGAFSFVRGSMGDAGVTVVAGDDPAGEESYEVVCGAAGAGEVWMTLLSRGNGAAPFGYRTFEALALEAGTPLFESELRGRSPADLGLRAAFPDDESPPGDAARRLVGLQLTAPSGTPTPSDDSGADPPLPEAGARVTDDGDTVGVITRARWSPTQSAPLALAVVDIDVPATLTVGHDGWAAEQASLPFVAGGRQSGRLPTY